MASKRASGVSVKFFAVLAHRNGKKNADLRTGTARLLVPTYFSYVQVTGRLALFPKEFE